MPTNNFDTALNSLGINLKPKSSWTDYRKISLHCQGVTSFIAPVKVEKRGPPSGADNTRLRLDSWCVDGS